MDAFIKKLCDKYKVLESDVQTLLGCMEEVHFKKRDLIVREGTKNSNLYFIKTGIWRAYYHKDGADATIWFASDGEAAFSVWGYADNAYSLINIEAMCDSVAYSISRATLNQLYHSSIGLANLGLRLMDHPASSARKLAHQLRQSTSEGTLPDSYQGDSGTVAICAFKVHCILSVDNTAVAEQDSGILIIFTFFMSIRSNISLKLK